jgi:hypothetical protein
MSRTQAHYQVLTVFNSVAVRDQVALPSAALAPQGTTALTLAILNSLNQAGNYQVSWSPDGGTYTNVGTAQPLASGSGLTFVTGTPWLLGFGLYKVTYTATVSPTTGTLWMALQLGGV